MSLNHVIYFLQVFVESKKIRQVIREKKMEKAKEQKEVNAELFIVE